MIARISQRLRGHPVLMRCWSGEGLTGPMHLLLGLLLPIWVLCVNMWRVHRFTIDDAYISFRYARNLANGLGLVYNPGEAIEGYTNFLWTVLLAVGLKLGIDPHWTAKIMGAGAAIGTLLVVYRLSHRLSTLRAMPCVATWLLASSSTFSGYAMFGLETALFCFLVAFGTLAMFEEEARERGFVRSGLLFALAGLTRPEGPLFVGIPMVLLGRRFVSRRNVMRGLVIVVPLLAHLLWRRAYYGTWVPATLPAKTGDLVQQWKGGKAYVLGWVQHAGPVVFLALYGVGIGIATRSREILSLCSVFAIFVLYVMLVGGDWMSYHRFMAPAEPYGFVLVCLGVRQVAQTRDRAAIVALVLFGAYVGVQRAKGLEEAHKKWIKEEKRFWDISAGVTADWLATRVPPGRIAIGDIGYVGWRTDYPILDLLGLVDPVINQLPGGYTRKHGKGYRDRFFDVKPEYAVIILSGQSCDRASMKGSRLLFEDRRFEKHYVLANNVQVNSEASWCIFKRRDL